MFTDTSGGYFPLQYFADFLRLLASQGDRIRFITYDDLEWDGDYDYRAGYPREFKHWQTRLASGELSANSAYVLIQHDVDNHPDRTMRMLAIERELGIRSNVMLFRHRVDRQRFQATGEMHRKSYELDLAALREFAEAGFTMGYHANAYEQAQFDRNMAQRIFDEDIAWMRQYFDVRIFSAHGGCKDPEGNSNNFFEPNQDSAKPLRWVHNRFSVRFEKTYSDGGINNKNRHPEEKNLLAFVRQMRPGCRYRVLVHPQYYADDYSPAPTIAQTPWYAEVLDYYARNPQGDYWKSVQPSLDSPLFHQQQPLDKAVRGPLSSLLARARSRIRNWERQ